MNPGPCTLQTSAIPLSILPSPFDFFFLCISKTQRIESHYYLSMARRAVSQHLFTLEKRPLVCELGQTLLYSFCEPCCGPSPKKPPAWVPLRSDKLQVQARHGGTPVILALGRLEQEGHTVEDNLDYIMNSRLI